MDVEKYMLELKIFLSNMGLTEVPLNFINLT